LLHSDVHLRPWEVRQLRFPSELTLALDHDRYDPKKAPPGADAHGHAEVLAHLARRRKMTPLELLEEARDR
jgi:hypothetical protein